MKALNISLVILAAVTFLSACAQRQAPLTAPQTPPAVLPAAPKQDWEQEWQKTLVDARKEGRITIYGIPGVDVREALAKEFQKAYPGIIVEYTGVGGAEIAPKILAERRAGVYLVDICISGTGPFVSGTETALKHTGQPLELLLIQPEVKNPKNWMGGKLEFADKEKKVNLVMTTYTSSYISYNSKLVSPDKARNLSLWDLTKPEWEDKFMISDPRVPGPGSVLGLFLYYNPRLGQDFIRALAKNKPVLSRDSRLMAEWLSLAKYSLWLGTDPNIVLEFVKVGAPLEKQNHAREGGYVTAGWGSLIVMDKAPHLNAARIYLNWLLSREGQTLFTKVMNTLSRRTDVPTDHYPEGVLQPGVEYVETYSEEATERRGPMYSFMREVFGR